jgi:ribosomal protein S27AE
MALTLGPAGTTGTVIDGNAIAAPIPPCPPSLGVRPQAMKLRMVETKGVGRFVPAPDRLPEDAALAGLYTSLFGPAGGSAPREGITLWRFLRQTQAIVYSPFRVDGQVVSDAITHEKLGRLPGGDGARAFRQAAPAKAMEGVVFLPALCPNCGADLSAAPESVALPCGNCGLLWEPTPGGMRERPFSLVSDGQTEDVLFLPFWRMSVRADGLESALHLDPLKHVPPAWGPPKPISFAQFSLWSPAFFIHPVLFLRLSERATMWQPGGGASAGTESLQMYPVTMPASEAAKLASLILGLVLADRRKMLPLILRSEVEVGDLSLAFLPFRRPGGEVACGAMRAVIEESALKAGRNLS